MKWRHRKSETLKTVKSMNVFPNLLLRAIKQCRAWFYRVLEIRYDVGKHDRSVERQRDKAEGLISYFNALSLQLRYSGRQELAAPAVGIGKIHSAELEQILNDAFASSHRTKWYLRLFLINVTAQNDRSSQPQYAWIGKWRSQEKHRQLNLLKGAMRAFWLRKDMVGNTVTFLIPKDGLSRATVIWKFHGLYRLRSQKG